MERRTARGLVHLENGPGGDVPAQQAAAPARARTARAHERVANDDRKSAIAAAISRKRAKLLCAERTVEQDVESRGHGAGEGVPGAHDPTGQRTAASRPILLPGAATRIDRMFSETHAAQCDMLIREILKRMRHDGCGGRPGRVELLTNIEGASSRPVRKIVLIG